MRFTVLLRGVKTLLGDLGRQLVGVLDQLAADLREVNDQLSRKTDETPRETSE